MQTFLPYKSFIDSAKVLDTKRLGKQRTEARTLWRGHWTNHPASKMWRGYDNALALYTNVIIQEWISRGFNNNMELLPINGEVVYPPWLGGDIHATHRSNLLRKLPKHYRRYNWQESNDMAYVWPTNNTLTGV